MDVLDTDTLTAAALANWDRDGDIMPVVFIVYAEGEPVMIPWVEDTDLLPAALRYVRQKKGRAHEVAFIAPAHGIKVDVGVSGIAEEPTVIRGTAEAAYESGSPNAMHLILISQAYSDGRMTCRYINTDTREYDDVTEIVQGRVAASMKALVS